MLLVFWKNPSGKKSIPPHFRPKTSTMPNIVASVTRSSSSNVPHYEVVTPLAPSWAFLAPLASHTSMEGGCSKIPSSTRNPVNERQGSPVCLLEFWAGGCHGQPRVARFGSQDCRRPDYHARAFRHRFPVIVGGEDFAT